MGLERRMLWLGRIGTKGQRTGETKGQRKDQAEYCDTAELERQMSEA